MNMISSPFTCCVDNAPSDVQKSDSVLAEQLQSESLLDFLYLWTHTDADDHLSDVLYISTSDFQPDFSALVENQQKPDLCSKLKNSYFVCEYTHREVHWYVQQIYISSDLVITNNAFTVNYSVGERWTWEAQSAYLFVSFGLLFVVHFGL